MARPYLFLIVFFLCHCTKHAHYSATGQYSFVDEIEAEIDYVEVKDWEVGKTAKVTVSEEVVFRVSFNGLSERDAEKLHQETGATAWLFKVIKHSGAGQKTVGLSYAPFVLYDKSRGLSYSSVGQVYFALTYAAAYMSQRFRMLDCPAFEHNKKITSAAIQDNYVQGAKMQVIPPTRLRGSPDRHELTPVEFNGGTSLIGNYKVEMSLLDAKNKKRKGLFLPVANQLEVRGEKPIQIPGCQGARPEWNMGPMDRDRPSFQFGQ